MCRPGTFEHCRITYLSPKLVYFFHSEIFSEERYLLIQHLTQRVLILYFTYFMLGIFEHCKINLFVLFV